MIASAVYTVHSGFAEARILEMSTQCRPTLKDNLPEIRINKPGLMLINGLYRHGFLIAPAVMDCAIELLRSSTSKQSSASSALAKQLDLRVTHDSQSELIACAS